MTCRASRSTSASSTIASMSFLQKGKMTLSIPGQMDASVWLNELPCEPTPQCKIKTLHASVDRVHRTDYIDVCRDEEQGIVPQTKHCVALPIEFGILGAHSAFDAPVFKAEHQFTERARQLCSVDFVDKHIVGRQHFGQSALMESFRDIKNDPPMRIRRCQ